MTNQDKVIAVRGAAGALGAAVATHLQGMGYKVAALDLAKSIPGGLSFARDGVDLTDPAAANSTMDAIKAQFAG